MSITRQTTEKSTKDRNDAEIAFKEFLKKGGKVETIRRRIRHGCCRYEI